MREFESFRAPTKYERLTVKALVAEMRTKHEQQTGRPAAPQDIVTFGIRAWKRVGGEPKSRLPFFGK